MDAKAKAAFDKKHKAVMECLDCEEYYIIGIKHDGSALLSNSVRIKWRSEDVYLSNEKGEERPMARFENGEESLFYFRRNNEKGEPLLTPANKTLIFHFRTREDDDPVTQLFEKVYVNVADIVREGKVIF